MLGAWTLTDTGEFVLDPIIADYISQAKEAGQSAYDEAKENYASECLEYDKAKAANVARLAWEDAVWDYVSERTIYDKEFLHGELCRRVLVDEDMGVDMIDELLIEAFEGTM